MDGGSYESPNCDSSRRYIASTWALHAVASPNSGSEKIKLPAALKSQAKISIEDARATALKKVPGVIKEEEFEKENGKLVYSFDMSLPGKKTLPRYR